MPLRQSYAIWVVLAALLSALNLSAQPPAGVPPAGLSAPPSSGLPRETPGGEYGQLRPIRESGPPALYLRRSDGQLQVVPSLTMEKLDELLRLELIPSRLPPPFTFSDNIRLTGSAADGVAELRVTMPIRIPDPASIPGGWVRIPLRFHQAILTTAVSLADGTELDTEYDAEGDGYIAWLNTSRSGLFAGLLADAIRGIMEETSRAYAAGGLAAVPGGAWKGIQSAWAAFLQPPQPVEHVLNFQLKVPLSSVHGEKQLLLSVPNRPTDLRLSVVGAQVRGWDADDERPLTGVAKGSATELLHEGTGTRIHLAWRDGEEIPPVMQAEGRIQLRLVGRKVDAEVLLTVRSFGSPRETFDVRLPPGSMLIPGERQAGLEITPARSGAGDNRGTLITVRRREGKTSGPIEVRLKATLGSADNVVDISGFEVMGAQIQRGAVEFSLSGDATVEWRTNANVTRTDVPESLRAQQVVARFEYDQQPFSLQAVLGRTPPRVHVDPTYVVTVESDRLTLDARLRYRIRSVREERLLIDAGGWEVDKVGPPELLSGPPKVDQGVWEIPLANGELIDRGEFELQISARRGAPAAGAANELAAREVGFSLPRPRASIPGAAILIVSPADNIELTPLTDRLQSLIADTVAPPLKLPVRQQPPLVYREELGGPQPEFTGVFKVRRQALSVTSEYLVHVNEREWSAEQRFAIRILYEPASRLVFDAPWELLEDGGLEVLLDGASLAWEVAAAEEDANGERRQMVIKLPEERIGPCEIVFRYHRPHARRLGGAPLAFPVPFVRPPEAAEAVSSVLRLKCIEPIRLSLVDDRMQPMEDSSTGATVGSELSFRMEQSLPPGITLVAITPEARAGRTTVVERLWVQTLLTRRERRDRACFFLNTTRTQLEIQLPEGTIGDDLHVMVNGQPVSVEPFAPDTRSFRVNLGDELGRRQLTMELWYWFQAQPAAIGRLNLEAPRLAGASRPERAYWELRLPSSEHLVWSSSDLVSECAWRWNGMWMARRPQLSQQDLEAWVHASPQDEERGFNTYVFSSIGESSSKMVLTAVRPLAVLLVAGTVFLAGVVWLYWPPVRHPLVLLACSCLLVGLGVSFPDPAIAAAQVMVFGVGLVMLTRLLMVIWPRRPLPRVAARGSTFSYSDPRSSKLSHRRTDVRTEPAAAASSGSLEMLAASDEV